MLPEDVSEPHGQHEDSYQNQVQVAGPESFQCRVQRVSATGILYKIPLTQMAGSMILPVYGEDRNYGAKTWYDDYFDWDDSDLDT